MTANAPIQRHRTAMVRHSLSQPMSLLVQHAVVRPGVSVFDYGCGQGDDLRALATSGVEASGWDPHFAPEAPRVEADVVNLGFVLNVIEDPRERREALASAWALARDALCVSAMIAGQVPTDGLKAFGDGFVTSRGTFQKYFAHSELRSLIAETLGVDPASAAPGILVAFRRDEDREEFLLRRRMGRRLGTSQYRSARPRREATATPAVEERVRHALETLADLVRLRGRPPAAEEVPAATLEELARERVSLQRAIDLAIASHLPNNELAAAQAAMREDLLVHYALARLNRSASADRPSPAMVRDTRAHFGSQREMIAAATEYLMGLADDARVATAAAVAAEQGVGALDHRGRLLFDAGRREALPALLRVYLGCAAFLAGEPDDTMLVRLDPARRSVAYMVLDDRSAAFPISPIATTIGFKRQSVALSSKRRTLIAKSRVLGSVTSAHRRREKEFRLERGLSADVLTLAED